MIGAAAGVLVGLALCAALHLGVRGRSDRRCRRHRHRVGMWHRRYGAGRTRSWQERRRVALGGKQAGSGGQVLLRACPLLPVCSLNVTNSGPGRTEHCNARPSPCSLVVCLATCRTRGRNAIGSELRPSGTDRGCWRVDPRRWEDRIGWEGVPAAFADSG